MLLKAKEKDIGREVEKSSNQTAAGGRDLGSCAVDASGRDIKSEISKEGVWRAGSQLGTWSAAKSPGRFSSQVVGDFAHRSIPSRSLKF